MSVFFSEISEKKSSGLHDNNQHGLFKEERALQKQTMSPGFAGLSGQRIYSWF